MKRSAQEQRAIYMTLIPNHIAVQRESLDKIIGVIARRMRDHADDIDRYVQDGHNKTMPRPIEEVVDRVVHTVLWGVANMNLDDVGRYATELRRVEKAWSMLQEMSDLPDDQWNRMAAQCLT